ncbi:MAG: peroxiredoxin [Methanomassiliicoccales archaeon]|nr:MAG: peroxiredoxin [Methanomassiliicoccales archaeon]
MSSEDLMKGLREGDRVPGFTLRDQDGKLVDMSEHIGKGKLVIYFYPADFTSICTMEARAFREMHEGFMREGAKVFGISSDSVESHKRFATEHELPFTLLSDPEGKVREMFGAVGIGGTPARVTYVIDEKGVVRMVYSSALQGKKHSEEAMKAVKGLS